MSTDNDSVTRDAALLTIRAAVDRIIPADEWPAGWEGGVGAYLTGDDTNGDLDWAWPTLLHLAARLDQAAREASLGAERSGASSDFVELDAAAQDAVLEVLDAENAARAEIDVLRRLCWEGYYALSDGREPAGLEMVGFRAVPAGVVPVELTLPPPTARQSILPHYDAIVIGTGPGGGVAAQELTQAGKSVLLLERMPAVSNASLRRDHLHDKRNAVYRSNVGPGTGHPRIAHLDGEDRVIDAADDAALYGLNADALGGGTRVWQGMAWRFMPEDFRMRTLYGNPDGASLADWPVDYDEMEPFYSRAEWELGVAGEEGGLTSRTPRTRGYPMPAFGTEPARELLSHAADRLGWGWGPIPLALNSVEHEGRAACVRCAQCVGHACPVDAKNGAHNTFVPRAIATGNCDLIYDAEVIEVRDGADHASVTIMVDASSQPSEVTVDAEVVIVSAGAVETPRLLLASGIGNDHMGRHLHDHRFTTVVSTVDAPVKPFRGPGHSIATLDHVHGETIPWGGGVMVDLMSLLPLTSAMAPQASGVARWGLGHKQWMRDGRRNVFGVFGMGQEIPLPTSRVTLEPSIRDRWGRPGAGLRKEVHWASRQIEEGMAAIGARWLAEAGAHDIRRQGASGTASAAGEHSCGTARMGTSADNSATDPYGRVHGTKRVVVCDSSLHPTNGSVNPTLTIVANSFRVAGALLADWPR